MGASRRKSSDSGNRQLRVLEELLQSPVLTLAEALTHAATRLAELLPAEKVDAFLFDPAHDRLVSIGTSDTPLGRKQRELGLHLLPLSNSGRVAWVFLTGRSHLDGRVKRDRMELKGVRTALEVQSQIAVPLMIDGVRRGVLAVTSTRPGVFSQEDLRFVSLVAVWLGMIASRAELAEATTKAAAEAARRVTAEDLIRMFAHDLSSYVFPLRARLALLEERAGKEKRRLDLRDAQAASRSMEEMGAMLAELLDVARLEHGLLESAPAPVNLPSMVRQTAAALCGPERSIDIRGEQEVVLLTQPDRLKQVVRNLLSNALRHSPAGKSVAVNLRVESDAALGLCAVVEVKDRGPGIPETILPHLFEKFSPGPYSPGLGLGLYLSQKTVEALGGRLEAESAPKQGALFRLTLPGVEAPPPPAKPARRRLRTK